MTSSSEQQDRFHLGRTAATWFRDSFEYRGFWRTAALFFERLFEFARDLTPARRQLRYGDLQFDFDHRVDTTWSNVGIKTRIRELFAGEPYQPIEADQFHEMMQALAIEPSGFTFIDLGSGKGRALLLASEYPFRRVVGVEIIPELHHAAQRNVQNYQPGKSGRISLWCGDARDFDFPGEPTLLYLFNPFSEPVLQKVLANLELSLQRHPREFVLLYVNPLAEHLFADATFLRKTGGTHQFSVFRNHV